MKFKILSKKRNRLLTLIRIIILLIMLLSGFIIVEYDLIIAKIIFGVILLYNITPLSLLGKKDIGELELTDKGINFITQENKFVKLLFCELSECSLSYFGYKGKLELFYRGLYWNHGENKLKIKASSDNFDVLFLSENAEDKNKIIQYIEVLKKNNVTFNFDIEGIVYSSPG